MLDGLSRFSKWRRSILSWDFSSSGLAGHHWRLHRGRQHPREMVSNRLSALHRFNMISIICYCFQLFPMVDKRSKMFNHLITFWLSNMDLCASKMKTLKPIFSSLFTKKGFLAKEPQYQSSSCNRIIRLGHLGTSSFVLSFTHNVFAPEIRNFFRFPGKCDLLCNSHNIMHVLVRPIRKKDSVRGAPTSLQVVMAVYQMHQAASLDLVSLAFFLSGSDFRSHPFPSQRSGCRILRPVQECPLYSRRKKETKCCEVRNNERSARNFQSLCEIPF